MNVNAHLNESRFSAIEPCIICKDETDTLPLHQICPKKDNGEGGHSFHPRCVREFLLFAKPDVLSCPMCRIDLTDVEPALFVLNGHKDLPSFYLSEKQAEDKWKNNLKKAIDNIGSSVDALDKLTKPKHKKNDTKPSRYIGKTCKHLNEALRYLRKSDDDFLKKRNVYGTILQIQQCIDRLKQSTHNARFEDPIMIEIRGEIIAIGNDLESKL